MTKEEHALLYELERGIELALANAQDLFSEAEILKGRGFLTRAYVLHQISLEECGKIEILGASAMSVFMGLEFDEDAMVRAMRSHKAKNYANAYFASVTPEEDSARADGDLKASIDAFRDFQQKFHDEVNSAKNASLYVDFREGRFVSPIDQISEPMVVGIAAVNKYFLELSDPKARMMQRVLSDDGALKESMKWFCARAAELKQEEHNDMERVFTELMDGLMDRYKAGSAGEGTPE